jgi:flagellar basal-body rod protein FlgF
MTSLDASANNLANVTTPGFKGERALFQEHLLQAVDAGKERPALHYARIERVGVDHRAGPVRVTGRPLDVALRGDGYFAVQTPDGERYTRAGAFHLDANGTLMTGEGYPVLGEGGKIQISPGEGEPVLTSDGAVLVAGEPRGQLRVVTFSKPGALEKVGAQNFRAPPGAGGPQNVQADLDVGALEQANVSIVKGMTDLVSATRTFEALERAVEAFSELERRAANDIVST